MKSKRLWHISIVMLMLICVSMALVVPVFAATSDGDMGGAFSAERLKLAGVMIVVGLGMVFLVLAILWGVLVIFKKVMYDAPKQREAKAAASAPSAPTAPAVADAPDGAEIAAVAGALAYAQDDGAVVAAITAAIAEMIASDEHLSQEFAGGFRVVSFSRKSGKGAWNR